MRRAFPGSGPAAWAALAAASAAVLAASPAQYLGRQQDDLLYLIGSHALLSGGYRLLGTVGLPPLAMITPGFPLLLAPLSLAFGEAFGWHRAALALLQAALPWALWAHFRGRLEARAALLASLLVSTSPLLLSQAGTVMSETPYLLITLLLLGRLGRRGSAPQAGALALLAAQVRPAGLSLLPALLCAPLRARRWREAAWLGLPPLLGAAAWSLWSWKASGAVQEAVELRLSYGGLGWLRPLEVAADNAGFYLTALGSAHLPASWGGGAAGAALGLVLAALAARGVFLRLAKDPGDPESLLLLGGTALHAVWAWQYERYLIPLLPWAFWAVALGLGRRAPWALGTLLAGQVLFQSPRWVLGPSPWARPELARTYERLRADPDPSGALASVMHVRDGYHSRRPSLPLPEAEGPEELAALLKARRARLVLWQEGLDVGLSGRSPLAASLERAGRQLRDPRAFRLVFEEPREGATVYAPR